MALDQIGDGNEKEMTFIDHLEELRWHIVRAVGAIFVFAIAAFACMDFIMGTLIMGPGRPEFWTYIKFCELSELVNIPALCVQELPFEIISRKVSGQFMSHISVAFTAGLIIGFPYAFWEIWRFIKPGLHSKERSASRGATFSVTFLFALGVLFGYFLIAPISIRFFSNYQIYAMIENQWDLSSYVSIITLVVFGSGILFQLPVVVYFLTKAGLISSRLMKKYRKHSIIVILVLGALITPPDPFSQLMIALPLMLLYQISIVIAKRIERKKAKQNRD